MKCSAIRPGDVVDFGSGAKVAVSPARIFVGKAYSMGRRWDVYGIDLTLSEPKKDKQGRYKVDRCGHEPYAIQCDLTLGTDEVSPHISVKRDGIEMNRHGYADAGAYI